MAVSKNDPLVVVSSDTHIGPRLHEDLREYCPAKHVADFDEAVSGNAGALVALGKAFEVETDPDTDHGNTFRRNWQTEGHHDITARLRDMDYDGIAAEVIFHGSQNGEIIPFQHRVRILRRHPRRHRARRGRAAHLQPVARRLLLDRAGASRGPRAPPAVGHRRRDRGARVGARGGVSAASTSRRRDRASRHTTTGSGSRSGRRARHSRCR